MAKSHDRPAMVPMMVRVPRAERDAVAAAAARANTTESAVIRAAIREYLRLHDVPTSKKPVSPQEYRGQWVVLDEDDSVIAHGEDGVAAYHEARRIGVRLPRLFRVPDTPDDVVRLGL